MSGSFSCGRSTDSGAVVRRRGRWKRSGRKCLGSFVLLQALVVALAQLPQSQRRVHDGLIGRFDVLLLRIGQCDALPQVLLERVGEVGGDAGAVRSLLLHPRQQLCWMMRVGSLDVLAAGVQLSQLLLRGASSLLRLETINLLAAGNLRSGLHLVAARFHLTLLCLKQQKSQ